MLTVDINLGVDTNSLYRWLQMLTVYTNVGADAHSLLQFERRC